MLDTLFVTLFFTFPILVIKYMYKIGLNIFTISIPSFLMVSIFVFAYIGVLPLFFGWDEYRVSLGITNKNILFQIFLYNCITIFGLLLGFHFSKSFLKLNFTQKLENIGVLNKRELIFLIVVLTVCFIVFLIYLSKIDEIALFTLFQETYIGGFINKVDIVRSNMTTNFSGKYHWYSLFMHNILIVVMLAFFVDILKNKNGGWKSMILFIISFFLSSFISIMATEKAPFFWILISLFLVFIIVKYNSKIPIKKFIIFSILLFTGIVVLYYYMYWASDKDILYAINTVNSRIFAASIQPAYNYLEFFPTQHDFLYGRSFPNPKAIFPFETFNLTQEIMNFAQPEYITSGIVGSMPTIFWAEGYANFGLIGVFIVPFIVGVIIWIISYYINKIENTPIKVALYVWLILHFKNLSVTGFSDFIIDFYLIFTVGVFIIFMLFYGRIQKLFERN